MSKYTIQLEEDGFGNLIIPFTAELLEEVGWQVNDTLEWTDNKDGSFMITKQTETEWVLVETISQFRQRYVVEVPKGKSEYALDSVTTEDVKEFSQKHLGETIVSHRVISEKDALDLFDEDNDYLQGWTDEQKMQTGFTSAGYSKEEE